MTGFMFSTLFGFFVLYLFVGLFLFFRKENKRERYRVLSCDEEDGQHVWGKWKKSWNYDFTIIRKCKICGYETVKKTHIRS